MEKYQSYVFIIFGVIFLIYFGFKFMQAEGAKRLHNIDTNYGGGSFFGSIKTTFMMWFWLILTLCSVFSIYIGIKLIDDANLSKTYTPAINQTPVTSEPTPSIQTPVSSEPTPSIQTLTTPSEATNGEPTKIEQQKLSGEGSNDKQ
jgi:threonine/homoserine/homoserine lactone efflux protein